MNYSIILYILGWIFNFEAAFLLLPGLVALIYGERSGISFLITIAICLVMGISLVWRKPKNKVFYLREGFVVVSFSWIILSVFGSLPFIISGEIPSFLDALFEMVSGFTTTGASLLPEVESLSKCMIFWISFTHWIGGMGVLVFMLAILPLTGGNNMHLLRAESPGPSVRKLVPKVRYTAIILYGIYFVLTVLTAVFLLAGGMPLFDTLTTTFGTVGTGGFAIKNNGMAGYSSYLQGVVNVFMFLSGVNFGVYFLILVRRIREATKYEELRFYAAMALIAIALITYNSRGMFTSFGSALKHTSFQVVSILTTTGFSTTDFNLWPQMSKTILILLMFVGACAGSTGGGIKVSRLVILIKTVKKELHTFIHPKSIKKIKFDGKKVQHEVVRSINVFFVTYIMIFLSSVLLISIDNFDFKTNFTAVAATLNNIGPGFEMVGPTKNYSIYSDFSKVVLMFNMLAGRLELFPILIVFLPSTWRKY